MALTLIIGNKNLSSWSLRPYLVLRHIGVPFDEIVILLDRPDSRDQLLAHSPTGRVPVLRDGELVIWDSLAICEHLAATYPDAELWPRDRGALAHARSIAAEMHSGFVALRTNMPMNICGSLPGKGRTEDTLRDIERIKTIWRDARDRSGGGGDFLLGRFSIADAMFAPVVTRFRTYGVELDPVCTAYSDAVRALPAMQDWAAAAQAEIA